MSSIQKLYRKNVFLLTSFSLFFFLLYGCAGSSDNPKGGGAPSLVKLEIIPMNPSIAAGTTRQFMATGVFSDNSTQDLTPSVTWSSLNTPVATVSNAAGSQGLAAGLTTGTTTITAALGTVSENTTLTVTAASLVSISVTSPAPSMSPGSTLQFTATGVFSDNSTQDLTPSVTWSSLNTTVAAVSNAGGSQGLVSGLTTGTTTITAASGSFSGSTTLTVTTATLAAISVTPSNPTIAAGTTQKLTATGYYSDNSTQDWTTSVTWSSLNTTVAAVSNAGGSQGLASGLAAGTTTITAASGSFSGSTILTVTPATLTAISVTPSNPTIAAGTTQKLTATGYYSDNSTQDLTFSVTWSSSNTTVAVVSNAGGSQGLASGLAAGTTTITAASGGLSGSTILTVTPASLVSLSVTPLNSLIAIGTVQQFTAIGKYSDNSTQDLTPSVIWSSSNAAVATISNSTGTGGLASALSVGTASITAKLGSTSGSGTLSVATVVVADLQVQALSGSLSGSKLYVSDTEYNSGNQAAGPFAVTFYLSTFPTLNATTDALLGTRNLSGLAGGSNNSATVAYSIPPALAMGSYHLCAMTDSANQVTESDETNNTRCTASAYQVGPDLTVAGFSGSLSGANLYVSDTELNAGSQLAPGFSVTFYLTLTPSNPAAGSLVGSRSLSGLAAGATNSATTTFPVPSSLVTGSYDLCAITDSGGVVAETDETNNTRCTAGAYQVGPDLTVAGLSGSLTGTNIYVTDTELNSGNQLAPGFSVTFYLTLTPSNPAAGSPVGSRSLSVLAAGGTNSATTIFAVPSGLATGSYDLCAITDSGGVVAETNETNNTKCTAGTYLIGPDLVVSGVSASFSANTFYISDTEMNIGSEAASGFKVSFYLSLDTVYDSGDYFLGSRNLSGLAGGSATNSALTSIPIPAGTPSRTYYIIAVTDSGNVVKETNESNNVKATTATVTVP